MMIRRAGVLLLQLVCIICVRAAPQTQEEVVLTRPDDGVARTRAERQQALDILAAAAARLRTSEPAKAAMFLNRAALLHTRLTSPKAALATYRAALTLLSHTPEAAPKIESLNGIAASYDQLTRCDKAKPYIVRAVRFSEQHNLLAGKADALLTLSDCQNLEDHNLAIESAEKALQLFQSIGTKRDIARAFSALSDCQLTKQNLIDASKNSEAALNIWRELNDQEGQARSLINLGFIEYRKGAWQNCLTYLGQAQGLVDEREDPFRLGQIKAGIAEAFIESGMPEAGLSKAREALESYRQAQDPRGIAATTWDIGKAYYFLGNYRDAVATLEQAKQNAEATGSHLILAFCHDFLARTYLALDKYDSALSEFRIALNLYSKIGNGRGAARTLTLIGHNYEQQGKFDIARVSYRAALTQFGHMEDEVNESTALYALGRLELRRNNLELARDLLQQSLSKTENIRRTSTTADLAAALAPTLHERYQSYIDCLMKLSQVQRDNAQFVQAAFQASEMERGRSLAEMLRATETSLLSALDPLLSAKEKTLRLTLRLKEDDKIRLLTRSYKKEQLEQLEKELKSLEAEYRQVRDEISNKFPAFSEVAQPRGWDLKRIQQELVPDDQTQLLEYSLGSERSYAWIITRDGFASYQLPNEMEITYAAQKVYDLLQSNQSKANELETAAQALSQMVLFPLSSRLNKSRLIIVADGSLNYIPFQILPISVDDSEPMITKFEVVNAPSASVLGQLQQETKRRPQHSQLLAAFGDAAFPADFAQRLNATNQIASTETPNNDRWRHALRDIELTGDTFDPSSIQRLVYAQRELNNLRQVAGRNSLVATGFDATREKLQATDLSRYAILHFATHGVLDPKRPENSGLFLSMVDREGKPQNGFIDLQDIYNLRAPVDLVVLSACRTGLGKAVRGEGLIGLTRGFMYAGASSLVASLWKVDDEATAELMKQFYTNMIDKQMAPAAALREAQNTIRQRPEWRAPYYWAAFVYQGEYNNVIRTSHQSKLPVFIGVILVMLLATGGFFYYRGWRLRLKSRYSTLKK